MAKHDVELTFVTLIKKYSSLQSEILKAVQNVSSKLSAITPGRFLLLQFQMAQLTQVGDAISNFIFQVNSYVNTCVRNLKTS